MRSSTLAHSVWVVDDDVSIGWVLDKSLSKQGYDVSIFRSVKPLLTALKHDRPSVVISDVQMPGVDGLKLLQLMHDNFPSIPVIIMTAFSDYETTIKSYQNGAFEYLAKPFDLNHVNQVVEQACKRAEKQNERHTEPQNKSSAQGRHRTQPSTPWMQALERQVASMFAEDRSDISRQLYRQLDELLIRSALDHTQGHKQKAAKILGWGRNTLTRKMQDLGL